MRVYNLVRMATRTLAYHALRKRCPVNVMLAVTNRCNARCHYCQIPSRTADDIPLDRVLGMIDEMAEVGTVRLGLWGGEPLMRDDIGTIIRHAKSKGFYVTIDSNGLLWKERHGDLGGLDHVVFAVDGDEEAHEANRGAGTYARVREALDIAVGTEGLSVWTLTVLTKNNLHCIDTMIETAQQLGIHCAFQVLHHNDALGRNHDTLIPSNKEYREAVRHLILRKKEGAPIASSFRYLKYLLSWPDYQQPTLEGQHEGLSCKAGSLYCNVDADGSVYACSLLIGTVPAQNALEVGFRKAFDEIPPSPCQACSATCFTEYNYIYALDPLCIAEWMKTTCRWPGR